MSLCIRHSERLSDRLGAPGKGMLEAALQSAAALLFAMAFRAGLSFAAMVPVARRLGCCTPIPAALRHG